MSTTLSPRLTHAARRAFTLIELMVVLLIIGVIIAILLPALGLVRNKVRATTTQNMLGQINTAVGTYQKDHNRLPGYFTARDMAHTDNLTRGFSAFQNLMLDLAGFANGTGPTVAIGPRTIAAGQVQIDPTMMGVSGQGNDKVYWAPDAKHWVAQNVTGQQRGVPEHVGLLSVVDDFRNPLLAWAQDDTAVGKVTTVAEFAKASISGNADPSARVYWAPNAAFLGATAMGARGYDQTQLTPGAEGSMIGATNLSGQCTTLPNIGESLAGMLGNPAFPYRAPGAAVAPTVPAAVKSPLVLHSAGIDGIFVGWKDRGAKQFSTAKIDYQFSFVKTPGGSETNPADIYTDKDGKREIIDVMHKFDDIVVGGGN